MKRTVTALSVIALALGIGACGNSDPVAVETVTVSASPTTTTETVAVRQPGNSAQVDLYIRHINRILAATGESMSEEEALDFAESMCGFLDAGNSPYDAAQLIEEEGFPREESSGLIVKAIGASCTEHLK